jgi:hypothetical protein
VHLSSQIIPYSVSRRTPPPPFQQLYSLAPARTTSLATLDKLRAFRRRHESPTPAAEDSPKARGRSPGWLSKMHRNHSSLKRSRSPVVISEDSSSVAQVDGACLGRPSKPDVDDEPVEPARPAPPQMPSFLKLTEIGNSPF